MRADTIAGCPQEVAMSPETVLLSRIQFAFTIGYHILWPAYSIGLSGLDRPAEHPVAANRAAGLSRPAAVLDTPLRSRFCDGRGDRRRPLLRDRHQLERLCRADEQCHRAVLHLRGPDRLFPRGGLHWDHAVRHGPGRRGAAFLFLLHGGAGRACSARSGYSPPTAGCRPRPGSRSPTASSRSPIGGARSSTRPFPIASRIW